MARTGRSSGNIFDVGVEAEDQALDVLKKRIVQIPWLEP
jgi:hypothetical protein